MSIPRVAIAVVAILFAGGSPAPAAAQSIRVVATDFAFSAPATARPGLSRLTLVNRGRDVHHLVMSRLPDTLSASRMFQLIVAQQPAPSDVYDVGGPNATAPDDSSSAWIPLERGRYMLTCWITAPDGRLHVMQGMFGELVVEGEHADGETPPATMTITANEYSLRQSAPLRAGATIIEFANAGKQTHDLQLVRLNGSARAADVARRPDGDTTGFHSARFVGGVSGVGPGRRAWTRVVLEPGRYALFCFVPDEVDGRSHYRHGMLREVVVEGVRTP